MTEALLAGPALPPIFLSAVAVTGLVVSDLRNYRPGRYLFKPLAALAFIWLALSLGATASVYGCWLLAGLACCMAGDLLLMPDNERCFLAGLVAFLCGHLLYAVAFLQLPRNLGGLAATIIPALALLMLVSRWLLPAVNHEMKLPVALYTVVIAGMLICSGLSLGHPAAGLIIGGAWGFAISDLAVARRQFIQPGPINGLWGTPLYFLSQMLLAGSVALA
jgi:uncharacterized membrane protein YhhN